MLTLTVLCSFSSSRHWRWPLYWKRP